MSAVGSNRGVSGQTAAPQKDHAFTNFLLGMQKTIEGEIENPFAHLRKK